MKFLSTKKKCASYREGLGLGVRGRWSLQKEESIWIDWRGEWTKIKVVG